MDTPALEQLVGAYFHQDWMLEHHDEWAVIDDFITAERALAPQLPDEVASVLVAYSSEPEVQAFLLRLGSCYTTRDPEGYRGWLTEVARRVREATT